MAWLLALEAAFGALLLRLWFLCWLLGSDLRSRLLGVGRLLGGLLDGFLQLDCDIRFREMDGLEIIIT